MQVHELVSVIVNQLISLATTIPHAEELERAKTQLISSLLMNLEARPVLFEDVGRQIMGHGAPRSPLHYIDLISELCRFGYFLEIHDNVEANVRFGVFNDLYLLGMDCMQFAIIHDFYDLFFAYFMNE